ncbi:MAG TPA: hypothetical protein VFP50_05420 [Anaeromyxobacteraceae bacterium]|nr:hypothetical protein [Anaeromyxobacteraceae bacterium]
MTFPVALLLAPALAAAEPIVLMPATGANVHDGYLEAATDVLRSQLERTGAFEVVPGPAAPKGAPAPTAAQAGEAARQAGTARAVTLRISRLGSTASVRLAAYRQDGAQVHADELTAGTPDELTPVLRRLAEGLATGRPARDLAEIDTVTSQEADAYLKYTATSCFGATLGTIVSTNRAGTAEARGVPGGGIFWLYDARAYLAEVDFQVFSGSGDRATAFGLTLARPFSTGNLAPYAGGGLAYTWTSFGGQGAHGLSLRAVAGLLVGRLSNVQVRLEAGYFYATYPEVPDAGGPGVRSHGPQALLGVGF